MKTVRGVFASICIVFLAVFYIGTIAVTLNGSVGVTPFWFWIFIVAPPVYGLAELFAYIIRIGGRDE